MSTNWSPVESIDAMAFYHVSVGFEYRHGDSRDHVISAAVNSCATAQFIRDLNKHKTQTKIKVSSSTQISTTV